MNENKVTKWLMGGDPAISWQVMRDLIGANEKNIRAERQRVAKEGWGARLLTYQDPDGKWSGELYNKKWVSTTYTMLLLKELGMLPNAKTAKGCDQLFINGIYNDEEIRFSKNQKLRDNGITGMALGILSNFAYVDERIHNIAKFLAKAQNEDGSWYYDNKAGAEKYAFDTTLITSKGLLEYQKAFPNNSGNVTKAQKRGQEFLLRHRLFKNLETGDTINKKWLQFSYPNYWFYDILAALDYFRESGDRDRRLEDAVEIVTRKQNKDGTWKAQNRHAGKTFFDMEVIGKPSRWNTLRCLRVLRWWRGGMILCSLVHLQVLLDYLLHPL